MIHMDSTSPIDGHGSPTLEKLEQQLSMYKQDPPRKDSHSSSDKRAAVLVCIFQGDAGDLRVILTKRASTLSSHSGNV